MSSNSSGLRICSKTSRMSHSAENSKRLGSYTFGKALNNAMKQGELPGIDAWICASTVLARPLEAHERRHRHPEFDVWIVVDTAAKTWRRDPCWNKVLAFAVVFGSVLRGEELDVSREAADETPSFHSLGPVSQDVERHSGWSVGGPSFCVQRL